MLPLIVPLFSSRARTSVDFFFSQDSLFTAAFSASLQVYVFMFHYYFIVAKEVNQVTVEATDLSLMRYGNFTRLSAV